MVQGKLTHPDCYFAASACAALVNFPLWRMSAQAQSGFVLTGPNGKPLGSFASLMHSLKPPYRGAPAVLVGMTWARAAIFYGGGCPHPIMFVRENGLTLTLTLT